MFLFSNPLGIGSNFLQALGWAVINSLWQMAFLWVMFQVILSLGVDRSSVKSRIASIVLTTGFAWFLFTFLSHWLIYPDAVKYSWLALGSFKQGSTGWNEQLKNILPYASLAYLLLLLVPVIQFSRNFRFVQKIRSRGLSKCRVDLRLFVQRFAERMGIRKPVHVFISDLITSPVTIGFLKPIILMPIAAINSLTQKQVEAVLLHELAHIRRYDYFINLVITFIRTVLYFNPFVKLFVKTIEREREKSCDEMVMQFEYDPHGYASALLVLERNNFMKHTIAVAASGQRNDLLHRIEKILGIEKRKTPDLRKLGGLLAGLICVVALNALFFFSSPVVEHKSFAFDGLSNPFYQLVSDQKEPASKKPEQNENRRMAPQPEVVKKSKPETKKKRIDIVINSPKTHFVFVSAPASESAIVLADDRVKAEPQLKKYQEEQVKKTVAATKEVLEKEQWKQVEKNVGDALTQVEKGILKEKYDNALDKINWQRLEEKLRLSYNQINWNKVNTQLNTAITNIKLDSVANVYTSMLNDLNTVRAWMTRNKTESIPDTHFKLDEVQSQIDQVAKEIETVKAIRDKKIIQL